MYSWDRGLESIVQRRLMRTVPSPNECSARWPSGDEWSILHRAPGGIPAPQTPGLPPFSREEVLTPTETARSASKRRSRVHPGTARTDTSAHGAAKRLDF